MTSVRSTGGRPPAGTCQLVSAMIDSTCRSSVSVNFSPRPENTLMPLSSNGLCDALITRPASKPMRARHVGGRRRRDHAGGRDRAALGVNAARQLALDPVARLARVAADDEPERRAPPVAWGRIARTSAAPSRATVS